MTGPISDQIAGLMEDGRERTLADIAAALKTTEGAVRPYLRPMVRANILRSDQIGGSRSSTTVYRAAE